MSKIPKTNVSFGGETVEFVEAKSLGGYIKREAAENAILGKCDESALWALRRLPTADVVEVRHGRWLRVGQSFIDPNKFLCFECSICRCTLDNHIKVEQNYCPNCGARMDGEEQEHE